MLLLVVSRLSATARDFTYTYEGQTLTYTVISESEKTCKTKEGSSNRLYTVFFPGNEVTGKLVIPSIAKDGDSEYVVTEIGSYGFSCCKNLMSVTFPESLTTIGHYAFQQCNGLTSVTFPESLTDIFTHTFEKCAALKTVIIPGHTLVCNEAFKGTKLDNATINVDATIIDQSLEDMILSVFGSCRSDCASITIEIRDCPIKFIDDNGNEVALEFIGNKVPWDYPNTEEVLKVVNDRITVTGLYPNCSYWISILDRYKKSFTTRDVSCTISASERYANSNRALLTANYDAGDFAIDESYWLSGDGKRCGNGNSIYFYYGESAPKFILRSGSDWSRTFIPPTDVLAFPRLTISNEDAVATSASSVRLMCDVNLCDGTIMGFEWRRSDAPENVASSKVECAVANGKMLGELRGVNPEKYYSFRPYYKHDNSTYYGKWIGFYTGDANVYFAPELSTMPAQVSPTDVNLTGIALAGTDQVASRGFEYKRVNRPSRAEEGADGWTRIELQSSYMTATLTDLPAGTEYVYRAYAETETGKTYYSEEQTFTTMGDPSNSIEEIVGAPSDDGYTVYTIYGLCIRRNADSLDGLSPGIYIINGRKVKL